MSWTSSAIFRECYAVFVLIHMYIIGGATQAFPAYLIPQLKKEYPITPEIESWIGSATVIVSIISTPLNMYLLTIIGRKRNIQLSLLSFTMLWCLLYYASNTLLIRCILGVMGIPYNSILPLVTSYVSETCQTKRRGLFLSVDLIFAGMGSSFTYLLDSYLSWRLSSLILASICTFGLLLTFTIPESKYWYLLKENEEAAKTSMLWFQPHLTSEETDQQIEQIRDSIRRDYHTEENLFLEFLKSFRTRRYLKPIILGCILFLIRAGSGRPVIIAYMVDILQDMRLPYDIKFLGVLYGTIEIVGSAASLVLVYFLRRKTVFYVFSTIIIFSLGTTIATTGCTYLPWLPLVGLYIYGMAVSGIFITSIAVIVLEIQYPHFRGPAAILFMCILFLFTFIYNNIFPYIEIAVPIQYIFSYFLVNIIAGVLIVRFFVPETSTTEFYETLIEE